jgi:site-specific DNA recombinase
MTKQAIIYARFSPRPDADNCQSCEKQVDRCRQYCLRKNYSTLHTFVDGAESGGSLSRPGLQAAIDSLDPGNVLVVDSVDRLARDMLVYLTIKHNVDEAGATIEYANGSPLGTTPEGELMQNILAAFATYERSRIRLRTKIGLERKRKNGERTTGRIPIGWQVSPLDNKKLVPHEDEREAIILACSLSSKGATASGIAIVLDREIGLCRGRHWNARTVRRIIKKHSCWADPVSGDPNLEPSHS